MADPISFDNLDPNSGILTDVLRTFNVSLHDAAANVVSGGAKLGAAFMALQWVKLCLEVGITSRLAPHALVHFLGAAVWWSLCKNAASISDTYMTMMGSLGSSFGGIALNGQSIMSNPSLIIDVALETFFNLLLKVNDLNMLVSAGVMIGAIIIGFAMLVGLAIIGFVAIFAVVRAKLQVILGLVMLPFSIEPKTSFLAAKGLGMIVDAGIGLGATSLVIGFSYGFIMRIKMPPDGSGMLRHAVSLMLAGWVFAVLSGGVAAIAKGGPAAVKAVGRMLA